MDNQNLAEKVAHHFPEYSFVINKPDDTIILTVPLMSIQNVIEKLRDVLYFKSLMDIFCVDFLDREKRFEIQYNLLNMRDNIRIRVKTFTNTVDCVPSITKIFEVSSWFEREVFDMYGVKFAGNNRMSRILLEEEFEGHPMRKDFPVTGYREVVFDDETKKVIYQDVTLVQEMREFNFLSPWNMPSTTQDKD